MDLDSGLAEQLAQAIYERYCARYQPDGGSVPWRDLNEDARKANRGQAEDILDKLQSIGCAVQPLSDETFAFTDDEVERLARREHERWCAERIAAGWVYDAVRDNGVKHHPSLVGWEQLSTADKDKDRDAVRGIPIILAKVGLGIVRGPAQLSQ